jgi:ketosteroid isomerase-like protein
VKSGIDAIVDFLTESTELTAGTLRPVPQLLMTDDGHVAVLATISAPRPDGRTFSDTQVLFFTLQDARVRSVDQFIGDLAAVTSFWA